MKPETFQELLLEHLDGTLDGERRRAFEEHLRRHPEWRERVQQHEALDHLLDELVEETETPLVNGAVARVTAAVSASRRPHRLRRVAAGWWLAAAAAVLVAAGWWWQRGKGDGALDPEPIVAQPEEPPAFLEDPAFLADLPVILNLADLEAAADLLDVEGDAWMADVVALEVLDGA